MVADASVIVDAPIAEPAEPVELDCHFLFDPAIPLEVFVFGVACPHERIYIYKDCRYRCKDHLFLNQTSFAACIRQDMNITYS